MRTVMHGIAAAVTLVGVYSTGPADAQTNALPAWAPGGASIVDDPGDGMLTRWWRVLGAGVDTVLDSVMPAGPDTWVRAFGEPGAFQSLMNLAGFRVDSAEKQVGGWLPYAMARYVAARELSDADIVWLERELARDAKKRPGSMAATERSVVRALLDAQERSRGQVSRVVIDLFPLLRVNYTLGGNPSPTTFVADKPAR